MAVIFKKIMVSIFFAGILFSQGHIGIGDLNRDYETDILDILLVVNTILENDSTPYESWSADINFDETVNILDIVSLVNYVVYEEYQIDFHWEDITWELIGFNEFGLVVKSIISHPDNPGTLYFGTHHTNDFAGEVLLSEDNCNTWDTILNPTSVSDLAIDWSAPFSIYVGTNSAFNIVSKVLMSPDVGENWIDISHPAFYTYEYSVLDVELNPTNSSQIIAGLGGFFGGAAFISNDGGEFWEFIEIVGFHNITDIEYSPENNEIIYLVADGYGIWKSIDAGDSWALMTPNDNTDLEDPNWLVIDPRNPEIIYSSNFDSEPVQLYTSSDGGENWSEFVTDIPADSEGCFLQIYPLLGEFGIILIFTNHGIFISEDNGSNWVDISSNLPFAEVDEISIKTTYLDILEKNIYLSIENVGVFRANISSIIEY